MRLIPAILALAIAAAMPAADVGIRASAGKLPSDATANYAISGGGSNQTFDWSTSGSAKRYAVGVQAAWSPWASVDIGPIAEVGVEQSSLTTDAGAMTSASTTKLRGLYVEAGFRAGIYGPLSLEVAGRVTRDRGTYDEDELGSASATATTYGVVVRPVILLGNHIEVFGEIGWTKSSVEADGIEPAGSPGTSVTVSHEAKGTSYGVGVGYRF